MKCPAEGCTKEFESETILNEHIKLHHPELIEQAKEEEKMGLLNKKKEVEVESLSLPVKKEAEAAPVKIKVEAKKEPKRRDNVLIHLRVNKKTGIVGKILQQADLDNEVEIVKIVTVPEDDARLDVVMDESAGIDENRNYY